MRYTVTVTGIGGRRRRATLTTEHAASSYGQPVIVVNGTVVS